MKDKIYVDLPILHDRLRTIRLVKDMTNSGECEIKKIIPGELICEKWSLDLLEKYGNSSHRIDNYDLYYYYLYLLSFSSRVYVKDLIDIRNALYALEIDDIPKKELKEYMNKNGYVFVFPKNRIKMDISLHQVRIKYRNDVNILGYMAAIFHKLNDIIYESYVESEYKMCYYVHLLMIKYKTSTIIESLKKKGLKDIKLLNQYSSSGAVFFTAKYRDRLVFIKGYDLLGLIKNENEILKRINNSVAVIPHWYSELSDDRICVYQYVEGRSLKEYIKNGEIDDRMARDIEGFLKKTLYSLEKNGVEHCDIRPDNIIIEKKGDDYEFFLLDLGWAKSQNNNLTHKLGYRYLSAHLGENYRYTKFATNDHAATYEMLYEIQIKYDVKIDTQYFLGKIKQVESESYHE